MKSLFLKRRFINFDVSWVAASQYALDTGTSMTRINYLIRNNLIRNRVNPRFFNNGKMSIYDVDEKSRVLLDTQRSKRRPGRKNSLAKFFREKEGKTILQTKNPQKRG